MNKPKLTIDGLIVINKEVQKCINQDRDCKPLECMGATHLEPSRHQDEGFNFTCMPVEKIIRVER
jgi:hypothetical protein